MSKWKNVRTYMEVNPYTGQPKTEDAPANATGVNVAGTGDDSSVVPIDPRKKKKKETLLDARSKEYKAHRARLEAKRAKRAEQKNRFINKVKESISEFNRESYLEENNMNVLKDIVVRKQAKPIKFKDGTMKIDMFTASAITQVYNKVNIDNKKKLENMVNGTKGQFMALSKKIMKMVGR